jgi:Domain of unknown function (DUF4390)
MDFFTRFFSTKAASSRLASACLWCCLCVSLGLLGSAHAQAIRAQSVQLHKAEEGLQISANVAIELPAAVQEALLKGISVVFVTQAQVFKDRWYWYDKQVGNQSRQLRLSYQPLTSRWRLQISANSAAGHAGFSQQFDTLSAALGAIGRVSQWKIADWSDLEVDSKYNIEWRFRLDTSQLPRLFQIGAGNSGDWQMGTQQTIRYTHDGKLDAVK